jgi:hypothetical protein
MILAACSGEGEPGDGTDDTASSGGDVGAGGSQLPTTGGASASGGMSSGGMAQVGGAGGTFGTGGSIEGAGGESPIGGSPGTGGTGDGGSGDGGSGDGGSGTGGMESGTCEKGTTAGNEVLFIGESFVAASSIPEETASLAEAAGSLGAGESYVDRSVSGTWIGNGASNSIPRQYTDNSSGVRFVLMNGGGNDCWQGGQESDRTNALNAAAQLFEDMGANGVEKIVYFFYPDPIGAQFDALTACLDLLRPEMKALCDGQTSPECAWVDLRETWDGHPEYTSDGIHVAGPGNAPTAGAIFAAMEENCVAP